MEVHQLRMEGHQQRQEFQELKDKIDDLLKAWNAATQLVAFIKLAASIVAALGILWASVTHFWTRP